MLPIVILMYGWRFCSKFNFIAAFLILANLATFLDDANEKADVSNNDG